MKVIPHPQWKDSGDYKEPVDDDKIRVPRLEVDNATTYIDKDGSDNMTFTDSVTGTKTLAELATVGGGETPADTVTAETSFGVSSSAGAATTYSRGDHTHGTPTNPVTAHALLTATHGAADIADVSDIAVDANLSVSAQAAISVSHAQQHSITSTSDHTSTATTGQVLKADANGLPVDATNTDADVADAVSKKHSQNTDTDLDTTFEAALKNTDNHTSGTTNKVYTAIEQTKLAGIEAGADVTSSHAPQAHAASHVAGDAIQNATAAQVGLATAAQITKLDGIEASADVTDATNVAAAGAVMDADFAAVDEVMVGTGVGTHGQVTLAASQFLAKKATGAATNVTATEARAILNVADGADVTGSNAPQAHKDSHDPNDGSDKLDTANAAEIAGVQAAGAGTSHSLAAADHAHQIQHGITDNHLLTVDDASAADNDFAVFTANGLEGLTVAETLAALFAGDLPENTLIRFDSAPSADAKYSGYGFPGTAGATLIFGDVVYLASSGKWLLAKGDAEATTKPEVAIVIVGGADTEAILLSQDVHIREDDWNWTTVGAPLFISTATAGDMMETAPASATYAKVVGHVRSADSIHFRPDNVWVLVA